MLDRVATLVSSSELESIRRGLAALPDRRVPTAEHVSERSRGKELHKRRLAALAVNLLIVVTLGVCMVVALSASAAVGSHDNDAFNPILVFIAQAGGIAGPLVAMGWLAWLIDAPLARRHSRWARRLALGGFTLTTLAGGVIGLQMLAEEIAISRKTAAFDRQMIDERDAETQTALRAGRASGQWLVRPTRWGRYPPGAVRVTCRDGGWEMSLRPGLDELEVFPRPARMRPRLVPAELLRRIGEHTGRAVGDGVEFAGIRPYLPGDQLRDINRAVSIRHGQLHVNQRAASRAADLVVMIDAFAGSGPVAQHALDVAVHGAAALATAYLRVSDRVGLVVLGGLLRWLGPAASDRQFHRIAEMMLAARYDSFVTPDIGRIPRTALPPGTLVVVFSPLLDPRGFGAITDLRQRGFPLIVVDTLRDEPPAGTRPVAALALRLWRLDRSATRSALRALGVPMLDWDSGTELDSVLAPLRKPPPVARRPAGSPSSAPAVRS